MIILQVNFFVEKIIPILAVLAIIGVAIGAVVTWINEGFWHFILYVIVAFILGSILAYAAFYALVILGFILNALLTVLRYVFYNAVSFFVTALIVAGVVIGVSCYTPTRSSKTQTTAVASSYSTYYCKASSLNVRSYASTSAPIIGKLKKGDSIKVYSINNGFAKVDYNGRSGFVSCKYISEY